MIVDLDQNEGDAIIVRLTVPLVSSLIKPKSRNLHCPRKDDKASILTRLIMGNKTNRTFQDPAQAISSKLIRKANEKYSKKKKNLDIINLNVTSYHFHRPMASDLFPSRALTLGFLHHPPNCVQKTSSPPITCPRRAAFSASRVKSSRGSGDEETLTFRESECQRNWIKLRQIGRKSNRRANNLARVSFLFPFFLN